MAIFYVKLHDFTYRPGDIHTMELRPLSIYV